MSDDGLVRVDGSERQLPPGAEKVGEVDPDARFDVSVIVRRKAEPEATDGSVSAAADARRAARAVFAERYGASEQDLAAVAGFAADHGLSVVTSDAARRTVVLRGTTAALSAAFGVELAAYRLDGQGFRGRVGHAHVPAQLEHIVTAVLGLDNRPQASAHFRVGEPLPEEELPSPPPHAHEAFGAAAASAPTAVPLWTSRVAQLYDFPTTSAAGAALDGGGQTIGILELGGGFRDADLDAYFAKAKIARPAVTAFPVGAGKNTPGGDADGEVMLDIEVAGSVAPGASIVVYFAENTDQGFLDALTTAVHDSANAPSVISISWGGPEGSWTQQATTAFDEALQDAATLGVTVTVAAGDHGAGDGAGDGHPHADFPASSPHVLACGGTTLVAGSAGIVSEVVWNDGDGWAGGGGVSTVFDPPTYQQGVPVPPRPHTTVPGRGVPDVAANADITSGYIVRVDGKWSPVGGTSAVAPLWAGLVALLNEATGHAAGYLNPKLYGLESAFRDIVEGDNSVPRTTQWGAAVTGYTAAPGWDACSGLGAVRGGELLAGL